MNKDRIRETIQKIKRHSTSLAKLAQESEEALNKNDSPFDGYYDGMMDNMYIDVDRLKYLMYELDKEGPKR